MVVTEQHSEATANTKTATQMTENSRKSNIQQPTWHGMKYTGVSDKAFKTTVRVLGGTLNKTTVEFKQTEISHAFKGSLC